MILPSHSFAMLLMPPFTCRPVSIARGLAPLDAVSTGLPMLHLLLAMAIGVEIVVSHTYACSASELCSAT